MPYLVKAPSDGFGQFAFLNHPPHGSLLSWSCVTAASIRGGLLGILRIPHTCVEDVSTHARPWSNKILHILNAIEELTEPSPRLREGCSSPNTSSRGSTSALG